MHRGICSKVHVHAIRTVSVFVLFTIERIHDCVHISMHVFSVALHTYAYI